MDHAHPTYPTDADPTDADPTAADPTAADRLLRLLLLVEAMLAVVTTLESAVVVVAGMGLPLPSLLTGAIAVALCLAARSAGRGGRSRLTVWLQWAFVAGALVDLVVAALLSYPPAPLGVLVRLGLPLTVLAVLRRSTGRAVDTVPGRPSGGGQVPVTVVPVTVVPVTVVPMAVVPMAVVPMAVAP